MKETKMIRNFDELKKQLRELSEIVNEFKSEAVQLRVVELVLGSGLPKAQTSETQSDEPDEPAKPRRRKAKAKRTLPNNAETDTAGAKTTRKSRTGAQGANSTLSDLVQGGFFEKPKTLNDIVAHCEEKLARRFKSNEFSGKLGRLTRDGVLDRSKNRDGQYEYVKP